MPLYDVSYHRFEGQRKSHLTRCWALARAQIQTLLKQRRFLFLLAVSWIPAIVRAGQIYVVKQFPQALPDFIEVSPRLWQNFLSDQISFLLLIFVVLYAGSGCIATDLRTGAIVLYLSRPISRMGYVLGKFLPVFLASMAITMLPGIGLVLFQILLVGDLSLLREAPWLPLSIFVYSSLVSAYFSLVVLAVSSLSRSARLAAAGFVMLALGSHFFYGMASKLSFGDAPPFLSLIGAAIDAANLFFGASSGGYGAPLLSLLAMGSAHGGQSFRPRPPSSFERGERVSTVEIRSVSRWYGNVLGLNRVELGIGTGVTALLGPNGAGKSTLIRLVTGQIRPSTGEILVFDQNPFANPAVASRLGLVPDEDGFPPRVTGMDWVVYLLRLHGFEEEEARRRAEEALTEVRLDRIHPSPGHKLQSRDATKTQVGSSHRARAGSFGAR